jgi:Derlin-2/3
MADVFWTWPPVTRTLIAATVATSLLVHGGLLPFYPFAFLPQLILRMPPKIPEIWRVVTPFLITSPKFGILMDPYFRMLSSLSLI